MDHAARTASWITRRERLLALAATQFGLVTREQARTLGFSDRAISRLVDSGLWRRILPGIFVTEGNAPSWHQTLMGLCLYGATGTVASHIAAGALWALDGIAPGASEITTHRRLRCAGADVVVHRVQGLSPPDVAIRYGIPVTSLPRTLVDLAATVDDAILEIALDSALRYRSTSIARVRWQLSRTGAGRAKKGTRRLVKLLDERQARRARSESPLETKMLRLIRKGRLPEPVLQFPVRDANGFIGRLDLAWPAALLAVECDSYRFHSSPDAWRKDRERDNRLAELGWTVLRPTADDTDDATRIVRRIRKVLMPPML